MKDDFYEGPPLDEPERWHDGAVFEPSGDAAPAEQAPTEPVIERSAEPTADPSLSRAVDRAAAGAPLEEAGYDRAGEGPAAGPLEPKG